MGALMNRWIVASCLVTSVLWGQTWEAAEEEIGLGSEEDALSTLEYFDFYRQRPMCLYRASVSQLCRLPGITVRVARAIQELLRRYPHLSYAELSDSLGLTPEQGWVLRQATTFDCLPSPDWAISLRSSLTLPLARTVERRKYQGSFLRQQGWVQAQWRWMQGSVAWDKDAGEPDIADFLTASLLAEPFEGVRCIVGDFRVSVAMGSLVWGGGGFRYPSLAIGAPLQWKTEVSPWGSVAEYGFFRGIALQWEPQWLGLRGCIVGWFSSVRRSGSVDTTGMVRSVVTDGIFATPSERERRNRFRELASGVAIEVERAQMRAAVTVVGLDYSHPLATRSRRQFLGDAGVLVSASARWQVGEGELSVECSRDAQGWWAWHGAVSFQKEAFQAVCALRNVPDSFRSPYGSIVSQGGAVSNEIGVYLGAAWGIKRHRFQVYGDLFRTFAPPYGMPVPRYGAEIASRWMWRIGKDGELWLQGTCRRRLEAHWIEEEEGWRLPEQALMRLRGDVLGTLNRRWRWRLRCDIQRRYTSSAVASLVLVGCRGEIYPWLVQVWFGVYRVPASDLGFWIYEEVAERLPRLHFVTGYGAYGSIRLRWELVKGMVLEATVTSLRRSSPLPLELWGNLVEGKTVTTLAITGQWRL